MANTISDTARAKIIAAAEAAGFAVELKTDGSDVYLKNLMFSAPKLSSYMYIRKDVATDSSGEPEYLQVALHPEDFRPGLVNPSIGIEEMVNRLTGKNLFSSSNYRGFPYSADSNEPFGKCYRVRDYSSLSTLLAALNPLAVTGGSVIRAITLENFKGIRDEVKLELRPITLLFGPNSAGKSSVLQALVYAREILERHNLDPDRTLLGGEWMDLGGFTSLINGHDRDRTMVIGFELDLTRTDLPNYLHESDRRFLESAEEYRSYPLLPEEFLSRARGVSVRLAIQWSDILRKPIVKQVRVSVNDQPFANVTSSIDTKSVVIEAINVGHAIFHDGSTDTLDEPVSWLSGVLDGALNTPWDLILPVGGQLDALVSPGRGIAIDKSVWQVRAEASSELQQVHRILIESVLSGLIAGPLDTVREELDKLIYIGPLREVPSRNPTYQRSPDLSRWARGAAAWDVLHRADPDLIDRVNDWLLGDEKLNAGYAIVQHRYRELPVGHPISVAIEQGNVLDAEGLSERLEDIPVQTRIAIREAATDLEVAPQDIGVGISQVLPIIVGALQQRAGFLAVEQPELHIHPALQVGLGDLIAECIAGNEACYLLETHSEHLILRLKRRVRETTDGELPPGAPPLRPEQVAIYFIESGESGVSVTKINLSDDGEFTTRWPRGFFTERRWELV